MSTIFFRAEFSPSIGFGHISRCLSLVSFLGKKFRTAFILSSKNYVIEKKIKESVDSVYFLPPSLSRNQDAILTAKQLASNDIIVLDGYNFNTSYQKKLLENKCKVVCIDDINQFHFFSDVILNHAEGIKKSSYSVGPSTRLYLGLKYAMVNPVFLKEATKKVSLTYKKKGEYFINMGGSDPFNNTLKVASAAIGNKNLKKLHIVIGKLYPYKRQLNNFIKKNRSKINLYENLNPEQISGLLKKCEVSICPASTMAIESCAVRTGLIIGLTAGNQAGIYKGLLKNKCAFDLGNINEQSSTELAEKINKFILNKTFIKKMIVHQKRIIDGKSPERIIRIFEELAK